jgi:hypothetical protein
MSGEAPGPRFDPRHDAIYQRGYQPGDELRTDAAASVARAVTDPAAQPAAEPSRAPQPVPGDAAAAAPVAEVAALLGEPNGPILMEVPRNPFIRALWIVGIAMMALSLLAQWYVNSRSYQSGYDGSAGMPIEMLVQQMVWYVASPMFSAGITTIVALLFWQAFHWRARDARPGEPRL